MGFLVVVSLVVALAALGVAVLGGRRPQRGSGDVDALPEDVLGLRQEVAALRAEAAGAIRHLGMVRYDAFAGTGPSVGGRLSWSVALLDDQGDGVVLTAIHGRSEARSYAKSVSGWTCEQQMSPEEEDAVRSRPAGQAGVLMVEKRDGIHAGSERDWDHLWAAGARGEVALPWDRDAPHDLLAAYVQGVDGTGRRAVVVGAGLGADAEHLATLGFETTAFDIAHSAVVAARQRHLDSKVDYRVADLLALPADLVEGFDLVVEIYTIQALHGSLRDGAVGGVRRLVAPGGTLFVVQLVREDGEPVGEQPPWLLDRAEMAALEGDGLVVESLDRLPNESRLDALDRWRMVLTRR